MQFIVENQPENIVIRVSGKMIFSDHAAFKDLTKAILSVETTKVILDMAEATFIDSAGIGMLLLANDEVKKTTIRLSIANLNGQVKDIFYSQRLNEVFHVID